MRVYPSISPAFSLFRFTSIFFLLEASQILFLIYFIYISFSGIFLRDSFGLRRTNTILRYPPPRVHFPDSDGTHVDTLSVHAYLDSQLLQGQFLLFPCLEQLVLPSYSSFCLCHFFSIAPPDGECEPFHGEGLTPLFSSSGLPSHLLPQSLRIDKIQSHFTLLFYSISAAARHSFRLYSTSYLFLSFFFPYTQ